MSGQIVPYRLYIVNEIENYVYDIALFFACPARGEKNGIRSYNSKRKSFLFTIFSPRGEAAADVPLRLVQIQQRAHLGKQAWIDARQALREVLVYGGF